MAIDWFNIAKNEYINIVEDEVPDIVDVNYDHLTKQGLRYIENGNGDNLKRLFYTIADHINTPILNSEQKDWIENYEF